MVSIFLPSSKAPRPGQRWTCLSLSLSFSLCLSGIYQEDIEIITRTHQESRHLTVHVASTAEHISYDYIMTSPNISPCWKNSQHFCDVLKKQRDNMIWQTKCTATVLDCTHCNTMKPLDKVRLTKTSYCCWSVQHLINEFSHQVW